MLTKEELKNINKLLQSGQKDSIQLALDLDTSLNGGRVRKGLILSNWELMRLKGLMLFDLLLLEDLWCDNEDLKSLNISNCPNLRRLSCSNNDLTEIDVSNCPNLQEFWCDNNYLKNLDVSNCKNLETLSCDENVKIIGLENTKVREVIRIKK